MKKLLIQKRFVALFFVTMACFSVKAAGFYADGIFYSITDEAGKIVAVTSDNNSKYSGDIVIPATVEYNGVTYMVKSIAKNAFKQCTNLESVQLGLNMESIGNSAFSGCTNLKEVGWSNSIKYLYAGAFYGCTALTSVELSSSLEEMGNQVFQGCTGITDVTINEGCSVIGGSAFYQCKKLESVDIPNSVMTIGESAFYQCTSLTSASIGDGIKSISKNAFRDCSDLQTVRLGAKVAEVGNLCFYGCSALRNISVYNKNVPAAGKQSFDSFNATLKVPAASIDDYKAHEVWGKFSNIEPLTEPTVYLSIIQADGGHLKQAVAVRTQCTFLIVPEDGWEINAVIFNGEDVTDNLFANIYVTPALTADAVLQVSFQNKTDVNAVRSSNMKAYGNGDDIVVKGTEAGDVINVYSIDGNLQSSSIADGGELRIKAKAGAAYIVKNGNKIIKVAL